MLAVLRIPTNKRAPITSKKTLDRRTKPAALMAMPITVTEVSIAKAPQQAIAATDVRAVVDRKSVV